MSLSSLFPDPDVSSWNLYNKNSTIFPTLDQSKCYNINSDHGDKIL